MAKVFWAIFIAGDVLTSLYLLVRDWPYFGAVNWLLIVPIDFFLGSIWPIYWAVLHWIS